jgi:hypothetical protein
VGRASRNGKARIAIPAVLEQDSGLIDGFLNRMIPGVHDHADRAFESRQFRMESGKART